MERQKSGQIPKGSLIDILLSDYEAGRKGIPKGKSIVDVSFDSIDDEPYLSTESRLEYFPEYYNLDVDYPRPASPLDVTLKEVIGVKIYYGPNHRPMVREIDRRRPEGKVVRESKPSEVSVSSGAEQALTDKAAIANPYGGIDLNQISVNRTGQGVNLQFDEAQISEITSPDFKGFRITINSVTQGQNPLSLMGVHVLK